MIQTTYASYKVFKNAKTPYIVGMKLDIIHIGVGCSILLYALNEKGYRNLNIISSMVQLNLNERLDLDEILNFQEGIYFISSGFDSDIDQALANNQLLDADRRIEDYKEKLNTFSIGLSLQNFKQEIVVAPKLKDLAIKHNLLLLPLNYMAHKK